MTKSSIRTAILVSLACILSAGLLAPSLLGYLIGPEAIRARSAEFLTQTLGREVSVRGRASFTLWPRPALVLEDIAVANTPGFGGDMLFAASARLDFRLGDIWSKRVGLDALTVFGARARVDYDEGGESNWRETFSKAKQAAQAEAGQGGYVTPNGFTVDASAMRIVLADFELSVNGPDLGAGLRITGVRLAVDPSGAFSLRLTGRDLPRGFGLEAEAMGGAGIDPAAGMFIRSAKVTATLRRLDTAGRAVSGKPAASLSAICDYSQQSRRVNLADVSLTLPGITLMGTADVERAKGSNRRTFSFELAAQDCDLAELIAALPGRPPVAPAEGLDFSVLGSISVGRARLYDTTLRDVAAKLHLTPDAGPTASAAGRIFETPFTAEASLAADLGSTDLTLGVAAPVPGSSRHIDATVRAKLAASGASGRLELRDTLPGDLARALGLPGQELSRLDGLGALTGSLGFSVIPAPSQSGETGLELSDADLRWPELAAKGKATLVVPALAGQGAAAVARATRGIVDATLAFGFGGAAQKPVPGKAAAAAKAQPGAQSGTQKAAIKLQFAPRAAEGLGRERPQGFDITAQAGFEDASGLNLRADISGAAAHEGPSDAWRLKNARVEGKAEVRPGFAPSASAQRVSFKGRFEADLAKGAVEFSQLALDAGYARAEARLAAASLYDDPKWSGSVTLGEFSPRLAAQALSVALPQRLAPAALAKAKGSFDISADAKEVVLRKIRMLVDATNVGGQAVYVLKTKALSFALDADEIDLANYSQSPPPSQAKTLTGNGGHDDKPFDTKALRELNVEGKLKVTWLRREGLVFKKPDIAFTVKNGRFSADLQSREFYGGRFAAEVHGQVLDRGLSSCADVRFEDIDADAFLRDLTGDQVVTGRGAASVSVCGRGESEAAWWREVTGSGALVVRNGVMELRESGKKPKSPKDAEQFSFRIMSASFAVAKGTAVTNDVVLDGPKLTATGKGSVNLVDETLDLALSASYDGSPKVPVGIKGPVLDPKLDIDRSAAVGETIFRVFDSIVHTPESAYRILRKFVF